MLGYQVRRPSFYDLTAEMARAQQRMRIEQIETKALEELGLEPDGLVADYGPDQPVPVLEPPAEGEAAAPDSPVEDGAEPEPRTVPYVREEQVKRLRSAEKALTMLGKVNPLALEEFSAMEERHKFLTEQLEDLKRTRKDLLDIVREVDERVEQVFGPENGHLQKELEKLFSDGSSASVYTRCAAP